MAILLPSPPSSGGGCIFEIMCRRKSKRAVADPRQARAEAAAKAKGSVLFLDEVLLGLPLHTERRVREHVVEALAFMTVAGPAIAQRVAANDVVDRLVL